MTERIGFIELPDDEEEYEPDHEPPSYIAYSLIALTIVVSAALIFNPYSWPWSQDIKVTVPPGWTVTDETIINAPQRQAVSPLGGTVLGGFMIEDALVLLLDRVQELEEVANGMRVEIGWLAENLHYYHLRLEPKE
ncbi:MAG: hypothetical protein J3T61_00525 [Candidatus Brocadiales bacterium]|nr:hypothetical protein [Candidatus Bathyanammoxibius sp.]